MVQVNIGTEIPISRFAFILTSNPNIISLGGDGTVEFRNVPTLSEIQEIKDSALRFDFLDSWEPSKLRNLTIQDINSRIATVQAQIDAVTNVAAAKTALNSMHADMQKMARIIIWLLKREMGET